MTVLLVASGGGHLAELHALAPSLTGTADRCWVTGDTAQSRSLLAGEPVHHVQPAATRDLAGAVRNYRDARALLRTGGFDRVISTGAGIAASFFLAARQFGVPCEYIESATRTAGPSLTGRIVAKLPGTRLRTQHPAWADARWQYAGSVFDGFVARPAEPRPITKVVVTLGTHPRYGFARLLHRLVQIMPPEAEVLWQVGATRIDPMPAGARTTVGYAELAQAVAEADVVITHAGVGSALGALQAGKRAIFVPRRHAYGEHVDDHQVALAAGLHARDLVLAREADALTTQDLATASAWTVSTAALLAPVNG
ncbi:MAG TPA: glycosyltransferase [Actinoplanes sp.]|nr:glycosyltransferase [Actinoplanes sp.]